MNDDVNYANDLFERVESVWHEGARDEAIDLVYDELDGLLTSGSFARVDVVLELLEPSRLANSVALSFLTIAFMADRNGRLTEYTNAAARVRQHLTRIAPDRVGDMMRGLD